MKISNVFGKLRELALLEEFKQIVSPDFRTYLNEKGITELVPGRLHQMITHLLTNPHMVHFKTRNRLKQEVPKVNIIPVADQDILMINASRSLIIIAVLSLPVNKIIPQIPRIMLPKITKALE